METPQNKSLMFVGHLEELDDLKTWDRNGPLDMSRQDNLVALDKIVLALKQTLLKSGKKGVVFISSPKLRAVETCHLIESKLRSDVGGFLKFKVSIDENLDAHKQGTLILPENYKVGDRFEGLKLAAQIYMLEFLEKKNLHYRFGDPVVQKDGSCLYPELKRFFSDCGESYADSFVRVLRSVVDISKKSHKLSKSVEVVVVAHGLTYHILRGLGVISSQVLNGKIKISKGKLAYKVWEVYLSRVAELKDTAYGPLDITNLENQDLINLLEEEISFLSEKHAR